MLATIHQALAFAVLAAVAVGIAWSLVSVRAPEPVKGRARIPAIVVAILGIAAATGVAVLLTGGEPKEGLHLLYGVIAVVVLPLARSYVPATDRRARVATLAAFIVLGFVLFRLFATG